MPQSKKRKKNSHSFKPISSYAKLSKHYIDEFERVAYHIMKIVGFETSEYASLTKRTRHHLMSVKFAPFQVFCEPDSRVPEAYLKLYNHLLNRLKTVTFYGNPDCKISFHDYMKYGLPFIKTLEVIEKTELNSINGQYDILCRLRDAIDKYEEENVRNYYLTRINYLMQILSMHLSSPIYRYYTTRNDSKSDSTRGRVQIFIWLSSVQPSTKCFRVKNEKHKGYQLLRYDLASDMYEPNPIETYIPRIALEEDSMEVVIEKIKMEEDVEFLPVYIQGHVIHRMNQRLDCMDNFYMNWVLSCSLIVSGSVSGTNGQRLIKAIDICQNLVGYFPFIIQDKCVLLLSFLPLSSPITPEGSILWKELGIQINDSNYIGLDKLSFYLRTDFDKLPQLKAALQKAGMWHLTTIELPVEMEKKEDRLLARFFEHSPDCTHN